MEFMTEFKPLPDTQQDNETFPVEPRFHPIHKIPRKIFDFFASSKLAMLLLTVILACCLCGVTILRGAKAWEFIFTTIWFNSLLVLLVMNVACCFFGRVWGRKITLISLGMILFHLSFVAMFLGIVYNSLFYFRSTIKITEGEVLSLGDSRIYDNINKGRLFSVKGIKGDITLLKLHTNFRVDNINKRVAYELAISEPGMMVRDKIFVTRHIGYRGFKYFPDSEGYSLLTVLYDAAGRELYGAHLPLQSVKQKDESYLYSTGTKEGPATISFPHAPGTPLFELFAAYKSNPEKERDGETTFKIWLHSNLKPKQEMGDPTAEGKAAVGQKFFFGDYAVSTKEVRYWTAIAVRYEPGQPIILTSLWVALFGVTLTTFARMFKKNVRRPLCQSSLLD